MDSVKDDPKRAGFPHSDIFGSKLARSSPKLFAACHVLHRLLAPRHPPDALSCLRDRSTSRAGARRIRRPTAPRLGTCLSEDDTSPPTSTATHDRPPPEGVAFQYRDAERPVSCGTMPRHRVMFQAPRLRRRRGSPHAPNGTMPSSSSPCRTAPERR